MPLLKALKLSDKFADLDKQLIKVEKNFNKNMSYSFLETLKTKTLPVVKENTPKDTGVLESGNEIEITKDRVVSIVNKTPYATVMHEDLLRRHNTSFSETEGFGRGPKFISRAVNSTLFGDQASFYKSIKKILLKNLDKN